MPGDILTNSKAPRDYHILETVEAGLVLKGTEVKSLRAGRGNLADAFARVQDGQATLFQLDIQPYDKGNRFNHEPKAPRRLLLHKNELRKLFTSVSVAGRSLVALKMYWKNNRIKVLLGVGVGKNARDKRQDLKKADQKREVQQAMRRRV